LCQKSKLKISANGSTVTATTFSGALSGNATTATNAVHVTDASQPNITSVGTLTGLNLSGITKTEYGGAATYENVAQYYASSPTVGTIVIKIASTPNMMIDAEIKAQGYGGLRKWHVRGYTYTSQPAWHMPTATCVGSGAGSCTVRVGKVPATDERVILLGNTSTNWGGYPHITVPRVTRGYPGSGGIGTWSISIVTSEAAYTVSETPTLNTDLRASTASDLTCTDCVGNTDLAANSVDLTSDALSIAYAGTGIGGGGTAALNFDCSEVDGNGVRCDGEVINVYALSASDGSPDSALYVDAAGEVGIGTTTPAQNLEISDDPGGTMRFYNTDNMPGTGVLLGAIEFAGDDAGPVIVGAIKSYTARDWMNDYSAELRFYIADGSLAQAMTLDRNGQLGIGDATPTYKLDVAGTGRFTGNLIVPDIDVSGGDITSANRISSDTDATFPYLYLDSTGSGDNWTSQGAIISIGEAASTAAGGGTAALHMTYRGDGYGFIGSGAVSNGEPGASYLRFDYNADAIYTPDTLTVGGNAYVSGKIYVDNTTNYLSSGTGGHGSLQINGNAAAGYEGFSINGRYVFMSDDANTVGVYDDTDNQWVWNREDNSRFRIYEPDSATVAFTMDTNGDVGIGLGDTDASAKLEVGGTGTSLISNTTGDIIIDPQAALVINGDLELTNALYVNGYQYKVQCPPRKVMVYETATPQEWNEHLSYAVCTRYPTYVTLSTPRYCNGDRCYPLREDSGSCDSFCAEYGFINPASTHNGTIALSYYDVASRALSLSWETWANYFMSPPAACNCYP